MAQITTKTIDPLLQMSITAFVGEFDKPHQTQNEQWRKVYKIRTASPNGVDRIQQLNSLEPAREKKEGEAPYVANLNLGNRIDVKQKVWGITVPITMEARKFNQTKYLTAPDIIKKLDSSLRRGRCINAMYPINQGTVSTEYSFDGKPLFAQDHPIRGGVQSNLLNADLTMVTVEAACNLISGAKDASGNIADIKPAALLVGRNQYFNAGKITQSERITSVGLPTPVLANDINLIKHNSIFPKGIIVDQYIENPNFASIITDVDQFIYFEYGPVDTKQEEAVASRDILITAMHMHAFVCADYLSIFGISVI